MTILKIKKLPNLNELNLPKYETSGSAGMDLVAAIENDIMTLKRDIIDPLIENGINKECELIKPPKCISHKMAEIMPPQNWYGQSKIA
jgi:dUTPase